MILYLTTDTRRNQDSVAQNPWILLIFCFLQLCTEPKWTENTHLSSDCRYMTLPSVWQLKLLTSEETLFSQCKVPLKIWPINNLSGKDPQTCSHQGSPTEHSSCIYEVSRNAWWKASFDMQRNTRLHPNFLHCLDLLSPFPSWVYIPQEVWPSVQSVLWWDFECESVYSLLPFLLAWYDLWCSSNVIFKSLTRIKILSCRAHTQQVHLQNNSQTYISRIIMEDQAERL